MPHVDGGAPFSVWRGKKLLLMGELTSPLSLHGREKTLNDEGARFSRLDLLLERKL
jgi:hypothetical protein